jgi:hypothetical protein
VIALVASLVPAVAHAQGPLAAASQPQQLQQSQAPIGQSTADRAERTAKRFGVGVQGGVGLDPELVDVGAYMTFGPIFKPEVSFRPGLELGAGELTTLFAINLDVLYMLEGSVGDKSWTPYLGAGPTFGLSHRGFSTDNVDNVTVPDGVSTGDRGRFDFSDTSFNGGMNFIAGVRKRNGVFLEMKATAWGVSNIRLLVGFNF